MHYECIIVGKDESNGSISSLPSDIRDDLRQRLKRNLWDIKNYYASYVRCIRLSLIKLGVSVKDLRAFLLSLDAFQGDQEGANVKLFFDKREKLEKASDIEDIFCLLVTECASFLNYEIFQSIISEYDINTSQEKLAYPEHLKAYINKHRLSEFYEINPKLEDFTDDSKSLVLKFGIELTSSVGTLKECTEAVANILGLKQTALRLLSIKEGCVIATLILPATVASAIFPSDKQFSSEQKSGFQALSVLWLKYNGFYFDFRKDPAYGEVVIVLCFFVNFSFSMQPLKPSQVALTKSGRC